MLLNKKLFLSAAPVALLIAAAGVQPALAQQPAAQQPAAQQPAAQRPAAQQAAAQQAPAQAGMAVGARVSDANGGEVGTISKVDGQFVILKTDKHEVRLPVTSFTAHKGGFLFGMTRDQLNAEVEKTLAAANAKIVPGASVTGSQGGSVGTIEAVEDEFVTVKLASGKKVRLPRAAVAPGPNGAVIGMTVAELEAAAGAAAEAPQEANSQ